MGYCSDVGLCLMAKGNEAWEAVQRTAAQSNANYQEIKDFIAIAEARTDADSGSVGYVWESIKWYDDFEEVIFIENLLSKLDSRDYFFIRIGESDDDIECHGGFWENPLGMRLVREIAFN